MFPGHGLSLLLHHTVRLAMVCPPAMLICLNERMEVGTVQPRRSFRDEPRGDSSEQLFPILATETTRSVSHAVPRSDSNGKNGEEKISLFWRIFGGAILSIVALVVITAYQSMNNSIHELRTSITAVSESRADLVKKEEYRSTQTNIWDRLQENQKEVATMQSAVHQLRDRLATMEESSKLTAAERKEMLEMHATIKERLAQFESRLNGSTMTQKDVQTLQASVSALQEKSTVRDQQLKQMEDERKEMLKEVQSLRERIAKMEAGREAPKTNSRPMPEAPDAGGTK